MKTNSIIYKKAENNPKVLFQAWNVIHLLLVCDICIALIIKADRFLKYFLPDISVGYIAFVKADIF